MNLKSLIMKFEFDIEKRALLQRLADRAQIEVNGKGLTFYRQPSCLQPVFENFERAFERLALIGGVP